MSCFASIRYPLASAIWRHLTVWQAWLCHPDILILSAFHCHFNKGLSWAFLTWNTWPWPMACLRATYYTHSTSRLVKPSAEMSVIDPSSVDMVRGQEYHVWADSDLPLETLGWLFCLGKWCSLLWWKPVGLLTWWYGMLHLVTLLQ